MNVTPYAFNRYGHNLLVDKYDIGYYRQCIEATLLVQESMILDFMVADWFKVSLSFSLWHI